MTERRPDVLLSLFFSLSASVPYISPKTPFTSVSISTLQVFPLGLPFVDGGMGVLRRTRLLWEKKDREDTEVKCVKRRERDVWVTWRFEVPKKIEGGGQER